MLSKTEINAFQKRLLAKLTHLSREQSQLRDEAFQGSGGEASGGISSVPVHLADLGSHESEEDVTLGLLQNEELLMKEIEEALTRIDQKTFGVCESCHKEIGKDRLEAVPYARYCVVCARITRRRKAATAARIVEPVARPSSTRITVFPRTPVAGRLPR